MAGRYTRSFAIEKRIAALCPYTDHKSVKPNAAQIIEAPRKCLTPIHESAALPLRHFGDSFVAVRCLF
jgi:hypothetical protein